MQPNDIDTLGKRLAVLRERTKINQQKLSNATGLSRSNLSKYEQDKVKPTSDAIVALCRFFNVSADWLLMGIESPQQKIEAITDPDFKEMCDILQMLMLAGDADLRGWTKIQFKNAFKDYLAMLEEEKKLHA